VQGSAASDAIVTPASLLGKPQIHTKKGPGNGETDVEPSAVVKITFTEPVTGNLFGQMGAWNKDSTEKPVKLDANHAQFGYYESRTLANTFRIVFCLWLFRGLCRSWGRRGG